MRIILINIASNVGKTTIATYILSQVLDNPKPFSITSDPLGVSRFGIQNAIFGSIPSQFKEFLRNLLYVRNRDATIDLDGKADCIDFFKNIQVNFQTYFDCFMIPTIPNELKIENETARTIIELIGNCHVDPKKIIVIYNRYADNCSYGIIPKICELHGIKTIKIKDYEIFDTLYSLRMGFGTAFVGKESEDRRNNLHPAIGISQIHLNGSFDHTNIEKKHYDVFDEIKEDFKKRLNFYKSKKS